ncbi:hypothetical protein SAY86_013363 [Trapa natans]|uniref:CRAL-TRIO domain-containing protein n=1 Tax=Trapa natans TaxID=22666 RepID=A0AAN7LZH0_TRANT|nr:hypothetical protein SAY86_013363 [Trapa natans]
MAIRAHALPHLFTFPTVARKPLLTKLGFSLRNSVSDSTEARKKLVLEVKEKLQRDHSNLPVGKNGRDDEEMIYWFLKDRKFAVDEATTKLVKAIKWHHEFKVSELSEESVKRVAETGKAYVHDFLDVSGRPVLVVVASKHIPSTFFYGSADFEESEMHIGQVHDPIQNEKLCAFLIERALGKLPPGKEEILGIFDLRGFGPENADLKFLTFIFDAFYCYYPRRLGQVLFVDAPFVFQPIWQLAKPLLKSYASLVRLPLLSICADFCMSYYHVGLHNISVLKVRFCSAETVKSEYFTEETLPAGFRD